VTFSIFHPTARVEPTPVFPEGWRAAARAWLERCDRPDQVEYVLSIHTSRWPLAPIRHADWGWAKTICNLGPDTNTSNVNFACANSTGAVMVGISDDILPPEHWDSLLLKAIPDTMEPWIIHASTTRAQDLEVINAGCFTRRYYQDILRGYLVHPSYESMFAEYELTWIAYCSGRCLFHPEIQFRHDHWATQTRGRDWVDDQHSRPEAYRNGWRNFLERRAKGFPR
jgi:hypothetical protein